MRRLVATSVSSGNNGGEPAQMRSGSDLPAHRLVERSCLHHSPFISQRAQVLIESKLHPASAARFPLRLRRYCIRYRTSIRSTIEHEALLQGDSKASRTEHIGAT